MSKILVSGLINMETTLAIEKFPLEYFPVCFPFFGVDSSVSGVAINIAKALKKLGDDVFVMSLVGDDYEGEAVIEDLESDGISGGNIIKQLEKTPQSLILYDKEGKRQIHCDLKDIQEREYQEDLFMEKLKECDVAVLCTINFSRKYLKRAKEMGKLVATDLHVIYSTDEEYHVDFMKYSDIVFMSDENITIPIDDFIMEMAHKYNNKIIAVGLGSNGAKMYDRYTQKIIHYPAQYTRKVVNTIGAGDSLFSAFLHYYIKTNNADISMKKAILFASYKIGEKGAAHGFLNEQGVEGWYAKIY